MFVFSYFIGALAQVVDWALWAYLWMIVARAVLSWVNPDPYNQIVRFLVRATEPVLRPVRRMIPMHQIGLDLSPMIVILVIIFLQSFLVRMLYRIAAEMG